MTARHKLITGIKKDTSASSGYNEVTREDSTKIHIFSDKEHLLLEEIQGKIVIRLQESIHEWETRQNDPTLEAQKYDF